MVDLQDQSLMNDIRKKTDLMFEITKKFNGVGLAASQVGLAYPLFVWSRKDDSGVAINPTIELPEPEPPLIYKREENCLSSPLVNVPMNRFSKVIIKAYDLEANHYEKQADGLLAMVFQHEMDHLHGYCIADHLNREMRRKLIKSIRSS
jgi:peptide deformylase